MKVEEYHNYMVEPKYDIRMLPVGGWKSARIGVEKWGPWTRFVDPDTHDFINRTQRIDYSKPYIPPRRRAVTPRQRRNREELMDEMFVTALSQHAARVPPVVPSIDITPEMLASTRAPKTARPATSVSEKTPERQTKVKTVTIDYSDIPKTARVIDRRRGDTNRCPFRVSSALIEARQRRETSMARCRGTEKKCARSNP